MKQNLKFILNMLSYPIAWKNLNLIYEECNFAFAKLFNLTIKDIIGKTDNELPWAKINNDIADIENDVITNKISAHIIYYLNTNDKRYYQSIEFEEHPLLDGNNIYGIIMTHDNIEYSPYSIINKMFNYKNKPQESINLTRREYQILYLLKFGRSSRNIAEFLSQIENKTITDFTIRSIINKKLYKKFKVNNTSDLIEIASISNIAKHIPKEFID